MAIALVSDAEIRALNRRYRGQGRPTDVLSFPADTDSTASEPSFRAPSPALGDLVIATGVARRQAAEAGHSYATELKVLALHGLLHLLGYDHHSPDDNGRMRRLESRLRRKGGPDAGLIERGGAGRASRGARPVRRGRAS